MQQPRTRRYDRSRVNQIRRRVDLNEGPLSELPDELLILAFTPPGQEDTLGSWLPLIVETYNFKNSDYFEWLGDTILELIVSDIILEIRRTTNIRVGLQRANEVRQIIVTNKSISCWMEERELCPFIPGWQDNPKRCADAFESLLGVLYFFFTRVKPLHFVIQEIIAWLNNFWHFQAIIIDVLQRKGPPCSLLNLHKESLPEPSSENISFPADRHNPPMTINCTQVGRLKNGVSLPIRLSDPSRKWLKEHRYNLTLIRNPDLIRGQYVAYLYLYPYGTPDDQIRAVTCLSSNTLGELEKIMEEKAEEVISKQP